jgi:hypothetical protein
MVKHGAFDVLAPHPIPANSAYIGNGSLEYLVFEEIISISGSYA